MPLQTLLSSPSSPCPHILQPGNRFNITGGSWPSLQLRRQTAAGGRQTGRPHHCLRFLQPQCPGTCVVLRDSVNGSGYTAGLRKPHEERGKPSPREPREEEPPCAKRCGSSCSAPGEALGWSWRERLSRSPSLSKGSEKFCPSQWSSWNLKWVYTLQASLSCKMTVRPYRSGSSLSHSQNEDRVGIQLPEREQENPPGEPHPKDAKWLCTGLASECFHLQPSEPPHSFCGSATMRPPILFPIEEMEPEAEHLV